MGPISLSRILFGLMIAAGLEACDNPLALPTPTSVNVVDTLTLYALRGTAVTLPSAFNIATGLSARTDRGEPFDFAIDLADDGTMLAYPAGALGFTKDAGILTVTQPFDSVRSAPESGYVTDSVVVLHEATVFVGRSRSTSQACSLGTPLPRYGKFRVLAIDAQARAVQFETLVNVNCGYRGLEPGLPQS